MLSAWEKEKLKWMKNLKTRRVRKGTGIEMVWALERAGRGPLPKVAVALTAASLFDFN